MVDGGDVGTRGPGQFVYRLDIPLHIPALMLVAGTEGTSHRV